MTRGNRRRSRHVPMRRCLGCGARRPRRELARFVARPAPSGHALLADPAGRANGRGLYTCHRTECFERAGGRNAFARAARVRGRVELGDAGQAVERPSEACD